MKYAVSQLDPAYNFDVEGVSYIGMPRSYTAMFVTKKASHLLMNLEGQSGCLIFAEEGMEIPKDLRKSNCFILSADPQRAYAEFAAAFAEERRHREREKHYTLTADGYYMGENVRLGPNCTIEPGCLIGHGVIIGANARILAGAVIKNAVIGDNFVANENAVVGAQGFTMTEDAAGNKMRVPTLGRVIIGDHVEIGVGDNISCGSGGDTILEDHVKIDALVHIAHDVHLGKNTEIVAGGVIGGFVRTGDRAFTGINASVRNRVLLEDHCVVGMGAVVTKSVAANTTVAGNPARLFEKKEK